MPVPLTPDLCADYFVRRLDEPLDAYGNYCPLYCALAYAMPDATVRVDYDMYSINESDFEEAEQNFVMPDWAARLARAADDDFDGYDMITGRIALGMLDAATGMVGATNGGAQ